MKRVLKKEGLTDKSLITIEVDSIIEANPKYISERKNLIQKIKQKHLANYIGNGDQILI